MDAFLFALWFFAPAGLANSAPVFANKIPLLNRFKAPLDFGKSLNGVRIFGANKTWRGLLFGMFISTLALGFQQYLYGKYTWAVDVSQGIDYSALNVFVLGPLFGFGALAGDAVESFFKRRAGVKPGESWIPFDQIDYIIGGLIASLPVVVLSFSEYIVIVLVWFVMHLFISYIGYLTGFKEKPI